MDVLYGSAARNQLNQQYDQGDNKQNVNVSSEDMKSYEPKEP